MSVINLKILSRDSAQGELTVEMLLEDIKNSLKYSSREGGLYLDGARFYFLELKYFKHKDFKKVLNELTTKYKNKIIQFAKNINIIEYTDQTGKGPAWSQRFINVLIKSYFKYAIKRKDNNFTFWYVDKRDAMEFLDSRYGEQEDNFDINDYTLKGFTYDPSK